MCKTAMNVVKMKHQLACFSRCICRVNCEKLRSGLFLGPNVIVLIVIIY